MKKWVILALVILVGGALLILPLLKDGGCEGDAATFQFDGNLALAINSEVEVQVKVACENIGLLEVICDEEVIQSWKNPNSDVSFKFDGSKYGLGAKTLNLKSTFADETSHTDRRMVRIVSDVKPQKYLATIVEEYPHNPTSFTQGLEFYQGRLFEGTGDPGRQGKTVIAEVDLTTGKQIRNYGLDASHFGEGITLLNDELFQLTWQNGKCFVYDVEDFSLIKKEFAYRGEGWGLCNDGSSLIMSNGSERLTFRDPKTFEIQRTLEVYNNTGPMPRLNELEYIDGKVYANVWMTNLIVAIDPITGKVLEEIDATDIVNLGRGNGEVLNGIAQNEEGKIYLTGKYWPTLFEVKFVKY